MSLKILRARTKTLHAWLAARAHIVPPSTMRDSNGDSNALSPTVGRQRPLMREHAKNRRCGHLCWLLIISGLGGSIPSRRIFSVR